MCQTERANTPVQDNYLAGVEVAGNHAQRQSFLTVIHYQGLGLVSRLPLLWQPQSDSNRHRGSRKQKMRWRVHEAGRISWLGVCAVDQTCPEMANSRGGPVNLNFWVHPQPHPEHISIPATTSTLPHLLGSDRSNLVQSKELIAGCHVVTGLHCTDSGRPGAVTGTASRHKKDNYIDTDIQSVCALPTLMFIFRPRCVKQGMVLAFVSTYV
jgi:hypothetical protein